MAFLKRRRGQWECTFRLRGRNSFSKSVLVMLFWLWGFGGLLFNGANIVGLTGSIGVGTSAYLSVMILLWIGGMLLFGIGALLSYSDFDGERQAEVADDIRIDG